MSFNEINPLTAEEVRVRLELIPFDEFEYDALSTLKNRESRYSDKNSAIRERFRQTGRTTKIICELLAAISNGKKAVFVSDTYSISRIIRNNLIIKYADRLGLPTSLILNINISRSELDLTNILGDVSIFYDHVMP